MNIIGWKAWYTDNRVYRSSLDKWDDLPKVGCLYVLVFFNELDTSETQHYKEIISGNRRYFMATGSSGDIFIKPSLWKEAKLLDTYNTKPEWIKEGIWDDDNTMERIRNEALSTDTW